MGGSTRLSALSQFRTLGVLSPASGWAAHDLDASSAAHGRSATVTPRWSRTSLLASWQTPGRSFPVDEGTGAVSEVPVLWVLLPRPGRSHSSLPAQTLMAPAHCCGSVEREWNKEAPVADKRAMPGCGCICHSSTHTEFLWGAIRMRKQPLGSPTH